MPETEDQTRTLPQGGLTDTERIEDILGTVYTCKGSPGRRHK